MASRGRLALVLLLLFFSFGCLGLDFNGILGQQPQAQPQAQQPAVQPPGQAQNKTEQPLPKEKIIAPSQVQPSAAVCGDGVLEAGEACDLGTVDSPAANRCPQGGYCSGCKCYTPAQPVSCMQNYLYAKTTGLNDFVFTTLPACGDDCAQLLGQGYKCDTRNCTCVPKQTQQATGASPTCGNGILENNEQCDGNEGICPAGQACSPDCICIPVPAGSGLSIVSVSGLQGQFNANGTYDFNVTVASSGGALLLPNDGFMMTGYIYDVPATRSYVAVQGNYLRGGVWNLHIRMPNVTGQFELKTSIICAMAGSACASEYGLGTQASNVEQFSLEAGCYSPSGSDIYTSGSAAGLDPFTYKQANNSDGCESPTMLRKWNCQGSYVTSSEVTCLHGCSNGACLKGQQSAFSVSTRSLPEGAVGGYYSLQLAASGGTPPYLWGLANGGLPDGLSLSQGGLISGTPLSQQSRAFTLMVTDYDNQTATLALDITVR